MIILGTKGHAKEILDLLLCANYKSQIYFYDDINDEFRDNLFVTYPVLRSEDEVKKLFPKEFDFTLGIGNPFLRKKLYFKFLKLGGKFKSTYSNLAVISNLNCSIADGVNILHQAIVANNVKIGRGTLIYYNALITHDVEIGDFCEISPSAILLGNCKIGNQTHVATNATILPNIKIGNKVIVAAGSVVTQDLPDKVMVAGVPAKIKKQL